MKPELVAELSANHQGDPEIMSELVQRAALAGVDAVKIQLWDPLRMVLDEDYVLPDGPWRGQNLTELYAECQTPWHWVPMIFEEARQAGVQAFASVFDTNALRYAEKCNCPRYKIASLEITDLALIAAAARTGKPLILSTGAAELSEITQAVRTAEDAGCKDLTLLKCTSGYPAPLSEMNLATMADLRARYGCKVGLSDHTLSMTASTIAAALGADMIEKHLTLDRAAGGPDAAFSNEPDEFWHLRVVINDTERAMGQVCYGAMPSEQPQLKLRRALYAARPLYEGEELLEGDLISARPALGASPAALAQMIGRRLKRSIHKLDPIHTEDLE